MGRKRTYGRAGRTSDREAEPYLREYGALQLSRRLVYLSLIFAWPGVATKAAESAGWAAGPHAVEPLTVAEEHDPAAAEIARRFNPAMALPDRDGPWPVSVGSCGAAAPICSRARSPATTRSCAPTRRSRTPTSTASRGATFRTTTRAATASSTGSMAPATIMCATVRPTGAGAGTRPPRRRPPSTRTCSGWTARAASWSSSTGSSIHSTSGSTTTRATGSTSTSCSRDRRASGRRPRTAPSGTSTTFTATVWRRIVRSAWRTAVGLAMPGRTIRWSSSVGTGARSGGPERRAAAAIPGPRRTRGPAAASVRSPSPTTRACPRESSSPSASTSSCCPSRGGSIPAPTPSCRG